MSRLGGRLKRLESVFGLNGGPSCTCLPVGARDDLIGKLTKPGEENVDHVSMPERAQCEATKHYWERENYRVHRPEPYVRAWALCVLFEDEDIPEFEGNIAVDPRMYYLESDYAERQEEAKQQTNEIVEILTGSEEAKHALTLTESAIRDRINKLRPVGLDPDDDDDPEKWLELPTDV